MILTNYISIFFIPKIINYIKNLFFKVSYNCIYFYSRCEILFNKYIKTNKLYLKIIESLQVKDNKEKKLEILFVKNNLEYNVANFPIDFCIITNSDFVPKRKIISYGVYEKNSKNIFFEESNINFMLIEFTIGEVVYKINLRTPEYTYYIINNKLTKNFFIYYVNKYILPKHKPHNKSSEETYIINLIDHNVNNIKIDFNKNECIGFEKDGYKIITDD